MFQDYHVKLMKRRATWLGACRWLIRVRRIHLISFAGCIRTQVVPCEGAPLRRTACALILQSEVKQDH